MGRLFHERANCLKYCLVLISIGGTQRFRQECSVSAMSRIILPHFVGKPYVTNDGKLPCPFLSMANALKMIEQEGRKATDNAKVWQSMQAIFTNGVQIEWEEHPSYLSSMFTCYVKLTENANTCCLIQASCYPWSMQVSKPKFAYDRTS